MGRYVFQLQIKITCRKCGMITELYYPGNLVCGHGKITEIRQARSSNGNPYFEYILERDE